MKTNEKGSALVYILIAIALLAALTVSFMEPSSQQTQSQNTFKLTSELAAQIEFIRTNVQECVVLYNGGDSGIDHSATGTDPGANKLFPLDPRSTRLTTPLGASEKPLVKSLRCPGNPGDNLVELQRLIKDFPGVEPDPADYTNPDHQPVFSGNSGKFMPPAPPLFNEWEWYNGVDGVFFWISSSKTDAYIETALQKLDEQYGHCETDFIKASSTATDLDNDGDVVCPAKSACFVVWMITNKADDSNPAFPRKKSKFTTSVPTCP